MLIPVSRSVPVPRDPRLPGQIPMVAVCLLLSAALLFGRSTISEAAETPSRPNVIFILADDLGWGELGCYGQQKIPTPNIDRLAREGTRFTQHYSGAPVCAPSRCVLMTGKHLGHAEIRGNLSAKRVMPQFKEGQYPVSEQARTIAQVFQEHGYATGAMGKWGLGPVGSSGEPNVKGFDLFFGYNCQTVAHSFYPQFLWKNREQIEINPQPVPGSARQPEGDVCMDDWIGQTYASHPIVAAAEGFLDANRDKPFFLYLPFTEPHVAMHPPRATVEKFPREWDDEPYRGECGYLPHPRPRAGYAAMISELDTHVGRILKKIDEIGVSDNTLVIFSSDNGATHPRPQSDHFNVGGVDAAFFNSTADLRGFKGSVYEGGIRVPMIVRYPGKVRAGAVSDMPGYFADWFPTLCEVAGFEQPAGLDGESLWPAIQDSSLVKRTKPMLWVFPQYGGQVAVRLGAMKVIRQDLQTKRPGPWQVYDLAQDRSEQHDLAASQGELIEQAKQLLQAEISDNRLFPLKLPAN